MGTDTTREARMIEVWEAHTAAEFELKSADAAIDTMTDHPVLLHVPVGTGAIGKEPLRAFYRDIFIPQMPADIELELLTRSVATTRITDEFILHLTHSVRMDWFLPGLDATGERLAVPHVGIIEFEGEKIRSEHIYWDHGTVLRQLGLIPGLAGALAADQAEKMRAAIAGQPDNTS